MMKLDRGALIQINYDRRRAFKLLGAVLPPPALPCRAKVSASTDHAGFASRAAR